MFKNMIMIMLLLTSCMDKSDKTTTETNTVTITNYVTLEKPVASYDKEIKVTRVFSDFGSWYRYQFRGHSTKFKPELYKGVYWDESNNIYYLADLAPTNNIEYTLDTNLMYEPLYFSNTDPNDINFTVARLKDKIYYPHTNELLYVGSISPTERIYIDTLHTNLFVKTLQVWDIENTFVNVNLPMYPIKPSTGDYLPMFTNHLGETFDLSPRNKKI